MSNQSRRKTSAKVPNRLLKCILAVQVFTAFGAGNAYAGPSISWIYDSYKYEHCEDYCAKTFLGQCVEWGEYCDYRSVWGWKDRHKKVIKAAMDRLSQRIDDLKVAQCIKWWTFKYLGFYAPKEQWETQAWLDFNALAHVDHWPKIEIKAYRKDGDEKAWARHQRNAWGTVDALHWKGNLKIEVNLSWIDNALKWNSFDFVVDHYAGTIVHEVMHQMGHMHTQNYDEGHFVVAVGDCVRFNGSGTRWTPGFDLLDEPEYSE